MKKAFFITILLISTFSLKAQEKNTFDLTIEITGMDTDKGKVFIALYNSEKNFLKSTKDTKGTNAVVKDKKAIAHFKGLKKAGLAGADLGIKLCQYNIKGIQVQLSLQWLHHGYGRPC